MKHIQRSQNTHSEITKHTFRDPETHIQRLQNTHSKIMKHTFKDHKTHIQRSQNTLIGLKNIFVLCLVGNLFFSSH